MYGRWVPGMSEGLHCSQPALDRELLPWLVIPATQPLVPTPNQFAQASVTVCERRVLGMSGCLHCSQLAPRGRTAPMAGNSRNQAMSPHPRTELSGTRPDAWDVWESLLWQPAPGKRTAPMAGNPRGQPSHRPHPAPGWGHPSHCVYSGN